MARQLQDTDQRAGFIFPVTFFMTRSPVHIIRRQWQQTPGSAQFGPWRLSKAAATISIAIACGFCYAEAQEPWAIDSMIRKQSSDSRLQSRSTSLEVGEVHSHIASIGSCSKFSANQSKSWQSLTALAERGVVEAQTYLAFFGMICKLAVPNRAEPLMWAKRASTNGYVPALEVLAQLYEWPGIPGASSEKSFAAYRAAAEGGSAASMIWTRAALCLGHGTKKDEKSAALWTEKLKAWYRANDRNSDAERVRTGC